MNFIDYYTVLEVPASSSAAEIKSSYRTLVKKYHPDINSRPDATAKMQLLNEAYLILSDVQAKGLYDGERKRYYEEMASKSQSRQSDSTQSANNAGSKTESASEFHFQSDILNDWIEKARKQAKDITAQAIKDTGGIMKEAGAGFVQGLIRAIMWIIVLGVIFMFRQGCHS